MIWNKMAQQMGVLRNQAGEGGEQGGGVGQTATPSFDPDAFKSSLLGEVTKMLNGGFARLEKQIGKRETTEVKPGVADTAAQGSTTSSQPGETADVRELRRMVEQERQARLKQEADMAEERKAAKEAQRLAEIKTAISKAGIASHAIDDAFRFFRDEVKRTDDGELVGGPEQSPLDTFVSKVAKDRAHWQPAVANGPGARLPGERGSTEANFDFTKLSHKSTPAQMENVRLQILNALDSQ